MSEELEKIIEVQILKKTSKNLDDKIALLLEDKQTSVQVHFCRKHWMTLVATLLFVSMLSTETYRQLTKEPPVLETNQNEVVESFQPVASKPVNNTISVSTSEHQDKLINGQIIELENGQLLRPVIRHVISKKFYIDPETDTKIEVFEPSTEIYYIPLNAQ